MNEGFVPPEGAKEREPELGVFWKPSVVGVAMIGIVESFEIRRFGKDAEPSESIKLSPCVTVDEHATHTGHAHMSCNVNSWLKKLVSREMVGTCVAIQYMGGEASKAGGNPMRTFKVFTLPREDWKDICSRVITEDGTPF